MTSPWRSAGARAGPHLGHLESLPIAPEEMGSAHTPRGRDPSTGCGPTSHRRTGPSLASLECTPTTRIRRATRTPSGLQATTCSRSGLRAQERGALTLRRRDRNGEWLYGRPSCRTSRSRRAGREGATSRHRRSDRTAPPPPEARPRSAKQTVRRLSRFDPVRLSGRWPSS